MKRLLSAHRATLLLVLSSIGPSVLHSQLVTGRIVDANGRPLPLVHVFASDSSGHSLGAGTLSDSAGSFRVSLGTRPRHLGFRRIGFRAEPPRRLDWGSSDTLRLDVVLHALPYVLPTVLVKALDCVPFGSADSPIDVLELWDAAVSAIAARDAFGREFSYQERRIGHNFRDGRNIPVDTTRMVRPPPPAFDSARVSQPLISYRAGTLFRKGQLSFSTADVRLLLQPRFVSQYCVGSLVTGDSAGDAVLTMRERRPADPAATVTWTMHFRRGFPGPTRITFAYFVKERLVGRAETRYELFDVGGLRFPLMSEVTAELADAETGKTRGNSRVRLSYSGFARGILP